MGFTTAVKTVLSKYIVFSGRAVRSEYWYWILAYVLVSIVVGMIDASMMGPATGAQDPGQPLGMILSLVLLLPTLAVGARRLHDIDRSGWWLLISFIPIIGFFVLLYWFVQRGTEGSNQYG